MTLKKTKTHPFRVFLRRYQGGSDVAQTFSKMSKRWRYGDFTAPKKNLNPLSISA